MKIQENQAILQQHRILHRRIGDMAWAKLGRTTDQFHWCRFPCNVQMDDESNDIIVEFTDSGSDSVDTIEICLTPGELEEI